MAYVLVPVILVVVAGLLWTWWSTRTERDPVSSVDSFHRALEAMQPERVGARERRGGRGPS